MDMDYITIDEHSKYSVDITKIGWHWHAVLKNNFIFKVFNIII